MIPGNDDAIRAVKLIAGKMADAVLEGQSGRAGRTRAPRPQRPKRKPPEAEPIPEAHVEGERKLPLFHPDNRCEERFVQWQLLPRKWLRNCASRTSAGMMDCKKALVESDGRYGKGHRVAAREGPGRRRQEGRAALPPRALVAQLRVRGRHRGRHRRGQLRNRLRGQDRQLQELLQERGQAHCAKPTPPTWTRCSPRRLWTTRARPWPTW